METAIKSIRDPNNINLISEQLKRLSLNPKSSTNSILELFAEIYKVLGDEKWLKTVNFTALCELVLNSCAYLEDLTEKQYHNLLASVFTVHKCAIKKDAGIETCNEIFNIIFDNSKFRLNQKHVKIYWSMVNDEINYLETKHMVINNVCLLRFIDSVSKLTKIIQVPLFCQSYLSWLVKKLFTILNEKYPNLLENALFRLFENLLENFIQYEDTKMDVIYSNLLMCMTISVQTIIACEYKCDGSFNNILKLSKLILKSNSSFMYYIDTLDSVKSLYVTDVSRFNDEYFKISHLMMKIAKKDNKFAFQEFILALRKILNFCMTKWYSVSDKEWKTVPLRFQVQMMELLKCLMTELANFKTGAVKCQKCVFESCIHDAMYLASSSRVFLNKSVKFDGELSELVDVVIEIFNIQVDNILTLEKKGCPNWSTWWSSTESKYHCNAIQLYSSSRLRESVKLFNAYFANYMKILEVDEKKADFHTLAKSYYNAAVCHLDLEDLGRTLNRCYTSMILYAFDPEWNNVKLHMTCIIKGKADLQNHKCDERDMKEWQMYNVWKFWCERPVDVQIYGKYAPTINFGKILLAELEAYSKLWFSVLPTAGICESLMDLYKQDHARLKNSSEFLTICSKAVTLISCHTRMLNNEIISTFVKFVVDLHNCFDTLNVSSKEAVLLKLLKGNCVKAYYDVLLQEKLKDESAPVLSTCLSDSRPAHLTVHPDDTCDVAPTLFSLTFAAEENITGRLDTSVHLWEEAVKHPNMKLLPVDSYIEKTVEIMNHTVQILSLRCLLTEALKAADVTYRFATMINNEINILNASSFIIEQVFTESSSNLIKKSNDIVETYFKSGKAYQNADMTNAIFEYLLSLCIYYFNCNHIERSLLVFVSVLNRINSEYVQKPGRNLDDIKFSISKLIYVQSMFVNQDKKCNNFTQKDSICLFTSAVNAYVQCSNLITSVSQYGRLYTASLNLWLNCGLSSGNISFMLGFPRRARAILKSLLRLVEKLFLPIPTAKILLLLAKIDVCSEKYDDCKVKLESIQSIIEEFNDSSVKKSPPLNLDSTAKVQLDINYTENLEKARDIQVDRYRGNLGASPVFQVSPFSFPSFVDHKNCCKCKKCINTTTFEITLGVVHLKAQLYFKTNELNVAFDYFDGGTKLTRYLNNRFEYILPHETAENFIQYRDFIQTEIQFYVDAGFFHYSENDFEKLKVNNCRALILLEKFPTYYHLLEQFVYEQKIFISHIELLKNKKTPDINEIQENTESIELTPEKVLPANTFKTPANRMSKPVKQPKIKKNIVKNMESCFDNEDFKFTKPVLKFDLCDKVDNATAAPEQQSVKPEEVEKTPKPRIRNKNLLLTKSETPSSSKLKQKKTLIRSTSPGSYECTDSTIKRGATRSSTRIKQETKINLSPDVDLVKKYSIRRKL